MTDHFDTHLDRELSQLAAEIAIPSSPALARAVAVALREPRAPSRFGLRLSRGVVLAILATLLLVGIAAALGFAIGGVRFALSSSTPAPLPPGVAADRGLGRLVTLDEGRSAVSFEIRQPAKTALGEPDHVYVSSLLPAGGRVALVYGDRPGFPADTKSHIGVLITEFRGDIGPASFEKLIHQGVRVDEVTVNGTTGYWVAGGNHYFFYRNADGEVVDETLRLVGDTLIWEEGGLTLRIEGAPSLAAAQQLAAALR
ncbi:MAG: hypothetical protein M3O77_02200 [Chloroflexota bacterium]|nr:hypothetical protein [Chloroflexota bacterium]